MFPKPVRVRRAAHVLALTGAGLALALGAAIAHAHHAFSAEFDADQPIELKGVVTKAKWVNPHSWLYFDVKGADGSETNWGVEFGAPFALQERGLTKAVLPPGTPVTVKGYRSKNGGPFGYAVTVSLQDGRTFQTGGAQDSPAAAANVPAAR
ncbi:DUF6152 family protein [Derxia gummosa]|uniref:DUF6152 family protein n=1 Tax=Derxia gummosa DSM 723 TaxID=1121388 RepID=A0A8B6X4B3_9BURK|nr:DUF6152 family protein [Derxia gummosa]